MPRIIDPFFQFLDDNGDPLVSGFLKFYESGTNNTDKTTYADINESIANANPVPLSGSGRCPNVFGAGAYNVISYTSAMVQIQQFDPIIAGQDEGAFAVWDSQTIYLIDDIVTGSNGLYYKSIVTGNQNQDPTSNPDKWKEVQFLDVWNTNVTYEIDSLVILNGIFYRSLTASNSGNNPDGDIINWRSLSENSAPNLIENIGFTAVVDTKALTFNLKTKGLLDPSSADAVSVAFRSETLTTGDYDIASVAAAASIIAPDGATLGFAAAATDFIYLYGINNAGAVELAVSGSVLDETVLHTTVAIDATADSDAVLYSTTLRSNVPIRLLGRINIETGAVAGEWDNAPTELFVGETLTPLIAPTAAQGASLVLLDTQTANNTATLDFITAIDSTFDTYIFDFTNMLPVTDNVDMYVRVSTDGGSSYLSALYKYANAGYAGSGAARNFFSTNNSVLIAGQAVSNISTAGVNGQITLKEPSSTIHHKHLGVDLYYLRTGNDFAFNKGAGAQPTTTAVDAIRFFFASGNISSGSVSLYGVKKS